MRWPRNNIYEWKRWFTWHPVTVGDEWVWLEWVERRHETVLSESDDWWDYRNAGRKEHELA